MNRLPSSPGRMLWINYLIFPPVLPNSVLFRIYIENAVSTLPIPPDHLQAINVNLRAWEDAENPMKSPLI